MRRYFFTTEEGPSRTSESVYRCADLDEVRDRAKQVFALLLLERDNERLSKAGMVLNVADEDGLVLFSMHFDVVEAPVLRDRAHR